MEQSHKTALFHKRKDTRGYTVVNKRNTEGYKSEQRDTRQETRHKIS
jgi:hypothetical protein